MSKPWDESMRRMCEKTNLANIVLYVSKTLKWIQILGYKRKRQTVWEKRKVYCNGILPTAYSSISVSVNRQLLIRIFSQSPCTQIDNYLYYHEQKCNIFVIWDWTSQVNLCHLFVELNDINGIFFSDFYDLSAICMENTPI